MDFIQSSGYKWFLHHKLLWKSNESYGISSHNAAQRPTHKDFAHIPGEPWSPEMDPSSEISALVNERIWSFTTFVPSYLCAPIYTASVSMRYPGSPSSLSWLQPSLIPPKTCSWAGGEISSWLLLVTPCSFLPGLDCIWLEPWQSI